MESKVLQIMVWKTSSLEKDFWLKGIASWMETSTIQADSIVRQIYPEL